MIKTWLVSSSKRAQLFASFIFGECWHTLENCFKIRWELSQNEMKIILKLIENCLFLRLYLSHVHEKSNRGVTPLGDLAHETIFVSKIKQTWLVSASKRAQHFASFIFGIPLIELRTSKFRNSFMSTRRNCFCLYFWARLRNDGLMALHWTQPSSLNMTIVLWGEFMIDSNSASLCADNRTIFC